MSLATWSIRRPVPAILLFALLTLLGGVGFHRLGIQQFPDLDLPEVTIRASLEGAAPVQLETEVARPIEDRLASLSRLRHLSTTITDGEVNIAVTFDIDKDGEEALDEVRNAVDGARAVLPAAMADPRVARVTADFRPVLTYVVRSERLDEMELSWFVDNELTKVLRSARGVARVSRVGGVEREVLVDLDPALMAGLGLTVADVSAGLRAVQKDESGGQGRVGGQRQSLRTLGAAGTVEEIAAMAIPLGDGRHARLDSIATVGDGPAERDTLAYLDGVPVIAVEVTRSLGFSDVEVAESVRGAVAGFAGSHPQVDIAEAGNSVAAILAEYRGSIGLLLEGAALAVAVVWWFLRDWRATAIAATALPLSIIPAFAALQALGYSLNTVSLLALALAVGVLVDDAIVEVENIARHLREGKPPRAAAMEAAEEIGLAVVATTLTLVAVFLPTAFMDGVPGRIFRQFGVTAAVAVLASLLVARLLTPMMAAHLMRARPRPTDGGGPRRSDGGAAMAAYLRGVRVCLRHPRRAALAALGFLALSLGLIPLVPSGFFPPQDDDRTLVTLTLAPGSPLDETAALALKAQILLRQVPEVRAIFTVVGGSSAGGMGGDVEVLDARLATLRVDLLPVSQRDRRQWEIEDQMREVLRRLPGARIQVGQGDNGERMLVTLAGDDGAALEQAAQAAEAGLRTLAGIGAVTSGTALQRPEIQIRLDAARAAALGVTSAELARTVRLVTHGDYATDLSQMNLPQRRIPIRVRLDPRVRADLDLLGQVRLAGARGPVSLEAVAALNFGSGPAQIDRLDRSRHVSLAVELAGRPLGEVWAEAMELPALQALAPSVRLVRQGELERMDELFGSFAMAMVVGVLCIYAVLVLLFHDFLQPVTILAALPLAAAGALLALLATGQAFTLPAVIGLLMLMGIVTKNSILLVEYAVRARRQRGLARFDALTDACRKRVRPILMTSIAMGAGMLPVALGLGADSGFRQPMAIVVIGGLLASTLLSLLVVPVAFALVP